MRDALLSLFASAARTASANGATLDTRSAILFPLQAELVVTAASGTSPTLDGKVQHSDDGSTWTDLAPMAQLTGVGRRIARITTSKRYLRGVVTIGGTSPSFTCAMDIGHVSA